MSITRNLNATEYFRTAFDGKFGSARLFGVLATLAVGVALARTFPSALYGPTTVTTFFLSRTPLQITTALTSAISALAYCALARWSSRSLNRSLILAQFVFFAIGLFMTAIQLIDFNSAISYGAQQGSTVYIVWHSPVAPVGFTSDALGCIVFLVNLGRTARKGFR